MSQGNIALLAMGVYLVLAFAIGMRAGRGRSFWSVSEYAVAERGLGLIVMWFVMGGTVFSAFAFLGGPGHAFSTGGGAYFFLAYVCLGILPWYALGPRIGRLGQTHDFMTMGDFLAYRYGSRAIAIIIGVISVLAFIQYLTLQIKGIAFIFNILTEGEVPYWAGALIAYGIVIVYVATSGVRGAAWSDVLQGLLMLIVAWTLGLYLTYHLHGGPTAMFEAIDAQRPGFLTLGHAGSKMGAAEYCSIVIVSTFGFMMWPHLFMKSFSTTARRIKQTALAFPVFALFLIPVLLIGFAGIGVVDPDKLDSADQILPYLVTYKLGASGWLYGLIGAGALAAAMSSADAITHGGSVSLARDVVRPMRPQISDRAQIWIMRIGVLGIGTAAYYLAIFGSQGIVALLLGAYGSITQFVPAVYGALLWRRATTSGVIAGLVVGIAVNYYFQLGGAELPLSLNAGFVGLVCNVVVFAAVSLITPRPDAHRAVEYTEA